MKLLAIDTSTEACSVGLAIDGDLLLDHRMAAQKHGALVLSMADALLAEAGLPPHQLDGVIYGRGPGSFTGVRIGVAVTQGIALGADIGVIGISTLQSVAQGCLRQHGDTRVAVSLDARMDEVYFACYDQDDAGLMQLIGEEGVMPPPQSLALAGTDRGIWTGSGAERYAELLQSSLPEALIRPDGWPMAQDLLTLGRVRAEAGELAPAETAMPVYLRDKVAQTTAERQARA